jgi:hypothetical protein
MNRCILTLCFFVLALLPMGASGQTGDSSANRDAASSSQTADHAAKAADLRKLMEVADTKSMMAQTLDQMTQNLKTIMTKSLPPGPYRAKMIDLFVERFRATLDMQAMADIHAAAYDKYFSDDDVKSLIVFYQTPAGQKMLQVAPQMAADEQAQGMKLGEAAGREAMTAVLAEHPEFKQAMQDAAQLQRGTSQ